VFITGLVCVFENNDILVTLGWSVPTNWLSLNVWLPLTGTLTCLLNCHPLGISVSTFRYVSAFSIQRFRTRIAHQGVGCGVYRNSPTLRIIVIAMCVLSVIWPKLLRSFLAVEAIVIFRCDHFESFRAPYRQASLVVCVITLLRRRWCVIAGSMNGSGLCHYRLACEDRIRQLIES
jgi:hypothetical protein